MRFIQPPLRAFRRAISFIFWRESIPGEFIASFCTMLWALASIDDASDGRLTVSINQLGQVLPFWFIHGYILIASAANLAALALSARAPSVAKWVRFVCYVVLFFTWTSLMWAIAQVQGIGPVVFAYLLPASIYAYGAMNILQTRRA